VKCKRLTDIRDSPFVAGTPAGTRCVGPTFSCPPLSPLRVAPLALVLCWLSKSCFGYTLLWAIDCCTVDKITALVTLTLSLALAITSSLQTLSYSDHTSLYTKRSKWTFSCHGSNRKENWTLITHSEIIQNTTHFKNSSEKNFHSLHTHTKIINVVFGAQTLPKMHKFLYSAHKHSWR